jgi:glycine oxidase
MKSSDVIIIGAGIIGLSLAIELRKKSVHVLLVERGEPGREASYAAAGMLAANGGEIPQSLTRLAAESADLYPEFVHELEDESGLKVDLREQGTIVISCDGHLPVGAELLSPQRMRSLEPGLTLPCDVASAGSHQLLAAYLAERSVDPRALVAAAIKAARHREVDISSGSGFESLLVEGGRVSGIKTRQTSYAANIVVNCAGAWAGSIGPQELPVKPVKGQMLAVVEAPPLSHVVRSPRAYLVPRTGGHLLIGSTLEDAGFNKQTDVDTLQHLFEAAVELMPGIAKSRRHDAWAGLRPGTPDELPILGETTVSGYFISAGHYRDGILLAPITARIMADLILNGQCHYDVSAFSPNRFSA